MDARVDSATIPLFSAFPGLARAVPRLPLGQWPTPIERWESVGAHFGLRALYVKREDRSHPRWGGNKPRGLEFTLAEAQRRGARAILTVGAAGSHHVVTTACLARTMGIETTALLTPQAPAGYVGRNIREALGAGARLLPTHYATLPLRFAAAWLRLRWRHGAAMMVIPPGGTSAAACVGHVNAGFELAAQVRAGEMPSPDAVFVPLGSLGTAAGLAVGLRLAGMATRVVGVVAFHPWYCTAGRLAAMARRIARWLAARDASVPRLAFARSEFDVVCSSWGRRYAQVTHQGAEAAREVARLGGPMLDGTYSSKTFVGMVDFARRSGWEGRTLLYWHTYRAEADGDADVDLERVPRALRRYFAERQALDWTAGLLQQPAPER